MKRIGLIAVLVSVVMSAAQAAKIEVHGHRGARAVMPENTLAAFNEALRVGVDVLELDMRVSKDNVVVVAHEEEMNPLICQPPAGKAFANAPVRTLALAEIKEYDCGSIRNPRFPKQKPSPGEKMPTLDEVFAVVQRSSYPAARTVKFNIETKIVPGRPEQSPSPEEFAALVSNLITKYNLAERVILQSFDYRTLQAMRKLQPKVKTAMLIAENHPDLAGVAETVHADIISPQYEWINAEDVVRLHAKGVQVVPWTVNDEKGWQAMLDIGVDAIITDDPQALIEFLKGKGLR